MDKGLFGRRLQKYREMKGYSQEELAEKIDCSAIFISGIECGKKSPSLKTLMNLANSLNVSADILLGGEMANYTSEKLKDMEKRLDILPDRERQRILDIMDNIITIELKYCKEQGGDWQ
ncbi:MAG: helix-turn-helix domain-containing protein [Lachnospiraceae bacterium]|nr:helix-turn-helix domain-containing protein [Lachnospiraceae bacterium]